MTARGRSRHVLVVDPLHEEAIAELRRSFEVRSVIRPPEAHLRSLLRDADVLVMRSGIKLIADHFAVAERLRIVARAGVGVDNIDLAAARRAGVRVFNVPDASADSVAEFAFGLILTVARRISLADRQVRDHQWNKAELAGTELRGKTLAVIGLGRIGSRVARLGRGFGMDIVAVVPDPDGATRDGVKVATLPTALARADVVILAVPLTEQTRRLITRDELALMKDSAYLVNVSRAEVVDEDDLYEALCTGRLAGAAVDVLAKERQATRLGELPNVVLTPHIGAMTDDAQRRIGRAVVESIRTLLAGGSVTGLLC
ncbi:hydroxyacid dehydrogenase [Spirillospora sp. NBC_00431]